MCINYVPADKAKRLKEEERYRGLIQELHGWFGSSPGRQNGFRLYTTRRKKKHAAQELGTTTWEEKKNASAD